MNSVELNKNLFSMIHWTTYKIGFIYFLHDYTYMCNKFDNI